MTKRLVNVLRNKRLLLIVLMISFSFNLLFVSLFSGFFLGNKLPMMLVAQSKVNEVLRMLPESKQDEIKGVLKSELRPELKNIVIENIEERKKLIAVIEKSDMSEQDLKDTFKNLRQLTAKSQERIQRKFIGVVMSLNHQERIQLAEGIRKALNSAEFVAKK